MKNTFNILFYLEKNKVKTNGCAPLMLRITINGQSSTLRLKAEVRPEAWDTDAGRVSGRNREATEINSYIDNVRSKLRRDYRELCDHGTAVTAAVLKDAFRGVNNNRENLLAAFDRNNEKRLLLVGKQITKATFGNYVRSRNFLYKFLVRKRGIEDIALRDISPQFISDFEHFLLVDCGLHRNTAMEVIKKFKHVMVIAHNNGMLSVNPFSSYKFKFEATERGYLSEDELITLMQHPLNSPQTEMIRDVFVFCCFTGLSYIDVKRLREEHIQRSFDDSLWIMIKRQKTGTSSNIPLLPIPEQIIEKYRGMDMSGALLPVPDNVVGNRHLKALGKQCGINKKVTFHLSRHSFATTVTLSKGVSIESVSKMLGHKSIKTTQHYARIVNEKVSRDMEKLSPKLGKLESVYAETKKNE